MDFERVFFAWVHLCLGLALFFFCKKIRKKLGNKCLCHSLRVVVTTCKKSVRFTAVLSVQIRRNDKINEEMCSEIINYGEPQKVTWFFFSSFDNVLQYDSFCSGFLARLFSEFWYKSTTNSSLDQHVCLITYKLNLWILISTCEFFFVANFCSSLFKHDYEIFVEKNWLQQLSHTVWLLFIFC